MSNTLPNNVSNLSQPPWYLGYTNRANPPDNSSLISANRYGYRGALNHLKYTIPPYAQPVNTRNEHTPTFLVSDENYVNEYVPKIMMGPLNTINGMETPKKWPENSEFVTGSKLKKLPTSFQYARETTVSLPERNLLLTSQFLDSTQNNLGIASINNNEGSQMDENGEDEINQSNLISSSLYSSSSAGDLHQTLPLHPTTTLLNGVNSKKSKSLTNLIERPYTTNSTMKKLKSQSQVLNSKSSSKLLSTNLLEPLPTSTKNLLLLEKQNEEEKLLRTYKNLESKNLIQTFPQQNLSKFNKEWSDIVTNEGTDLLKSTINHIESPSIEYNSTSNTSQSKSSNLLPSSNKSTSKMRYSGSSSILVQSNTTNEIKFQLRMKSNFEKVNLPYQLKWSHLYGHYYNINLKLKKNQNFLIVLLKIGRYFQYYSKNSTLKRIDFIKLCSKNFYFEDVNSKLMSQLYSLYDPMKKNSMRYIEILLSLLVLDCPNLNILKKLYIIFKFYSVFGFDKNIFEVLTDILTLCCNNNKEYDDIVHLIQTKYRLICYEMAWKHYAGLYSDPLYNKYYNISNGHLVAHLNALNNLANINDIPASPSHNNEFSSNNNFPNDEDFYDDPILKDDDFFNNVSSTNLSSSEHISSPLSPTNHVSSASSTSSSMSKNESQQYNICSDFLNPYTFVLTLRQCPELLDLFKRQLNARIDKCYGRNDEKVKEEKKNKDKFRDNQVDEENKDFSWIMKKEAPKRQVFGLF